MDDENPLWYDYDLADEPPAPGLLLLAALFSIAANLEIRCARIYRSSLQLLLLSCRALSSVRHVR